jgi:uncharacterized delta-60 repeat protein
VKRLAILLGLAVVALGLLGMSSAANQLLAGDLDTSFGHGGVVVTKIKTPLPSVDFPSANGVAVQPDGKIVAVGCSPLVLADRSGRHGRPGVLGSLGSEAFGVARYNRRGSPDDGFGSRGSVSTRFPDMACAESVTLQPDGKIVVSGFSASQTNVLLHLVRYRQNGALDGSFGTDGVVTTDITALTGLDYLHTLVPMALQPDGKIVVAFVAGNCCDTEESGLVRYNPDGSLDTAFGDQGLAPTFIGGCGDIQTRDVLVQPDGRILTVASHSFVCAGPGNVELELHRTLADGSPDPSFGDHGDDRHLGFEATEGIGDPSMALQANGRIVAGGALVTRKSPDHSQFTLIRLMPDGSVDASFGKKGFVATIFPGGSSLDDIAVQPNGSILAGGITPLTGKVNAYRPALVRYRTDGRLDHSFGLKGRTTVRPAKRAGGAIDSLVLQPNGKILASGYLVSRLGYGNRFLARYRGGNNCVVPSVRGKKLAQAKATLRGAYCKTGMVTKHFSTSVRRGRVLSQSPRRGTRLPGKSKVNLVVSKGKRR